MMHCFSKNSRLWALAVILSGSLLGACVKEEFSFTDADVTVGIESALATPLGYFDYDLQHKPVFFRMRDTISINLSNLNIPDDDVIEGVIFKLYYENSYPAEIDFRILLTTEDFTVTDTLFKSSESIKAAEPIYDPSEEPDVVSGQLEAFMPGDRVGNLNDTRYIIGEAYIMNEAFMETETFESQNLLINLGLVFHIETHNQDP